MTTDTDTLVARLRNPPFGTETSERNLMAAAADRLIEQQDKIHDAESGPWPAWASSILACLKEFGWRFDDLIDLPEELANYLREYPDSAVEGLQEKIADLTAQRDEARAGEDELAKAAALTLSVNRASYFGPNALQNRNASLRGAHRKLKAALASHDKRKEGRA